MESKPDIGRLDETTLKTLMEMKDFEYDKDMKLENNFPNKTS